MPHPNNPAEHLMRGKAHQTKSSLTFEQWEAELDAICEDILGESLHDLPDYLTRDGYEDGLTPTEFFNREMNEEQLFCEPDEFFSQFTQEFDEFSDADPGL